MIGWLILAAYVLGHLPSWYSFAMAELERHEINYPHLDIDQSDRAFAFGLGFILALIWPISIPIRFAFRGVNSTDILRTPKEKQDRQKAELEAYKKLARDNNLAVLDVEAYK